MVGQALSRNDGTEKLFKDICGEGLFMKSTIGFFCALEKSHKGGDGVRGECNAKNVNWYGVEGNNG